MSRRLAHDWFSADVPVNVEIGEGSWCYSAFAFLHHRSARTPSVRIGRHTGVYAGSFFELGPEGEVDIGDWCTIVGAIIAVDSQVRIGDHSFVSHEVVFSDDDVAVPPDIASTDPQRIAREPGIRVGTNVWIGARAVILGGSVIGDDAVIGAGAIVRSEIPAGSVAVGNPARVVGRVDA